ncbi:sulfotransferase, partial [Candidatus Sumerlaeota bacterium]
MNTSRTMSREGQPTEFGPIAVGGMGGSGTRLIAQILEQLGYFLGGDFNRAQDNLWFTLLFKRSDILTVPDAEFDELVRLFQQRMTSPELISQESIDMVKRLAENRRSQHTAAWLRSRAESFIDTRSASARTKRWGWKEPNTHVVLHRLRQRLPAMRYIHVVRNGLDMAFSKNHNQLKTWGPHFLNGPIKVKPYYLLKYWCALHLRVI